MIVWRENMKFKYTVLSLILMLSISFAEQLSPKEKVDQMLIKAWNCYEQGKYLCMIRESKKTLDYSLKHNVPKGIADSYYYLGIGYFLSENTALAMKYANKAIEYSKDKGKYKWLANSYTLLGEILRSLKKYDSALKYFKEALKLAEKNNNLKMASVALSNIGNIYFEKGDYKKAEEYYRKGLKLAKKSNNRKSYIALNNFNLGISLYKQKKYKEAIPYLKESAKLYKEINNVKYYVDSVYFLAKSYIEIGDKKTALKLLNDNIDSAKRIFADHKFLELMRE